MDTKQGSTRHRTGRVEPNVKVSRHVQRLPTGREPNVKTGATSVREAIERNRRQGVGPQIVEIGASPVTPRSARAAAKRERVANAPANRPPEGPGVDARGHKVPPPRGPSRDTRDTEPPGPGDDGPSEQ